MKDTKGGSLIFEVLDIDVFDLNEVLAFRVCRGRPQFKLLLNKLTKQRTLRVQKKTTHCNSRAHFLLKCAGRLKVAISIRHTHYSVPIHTAENGITVPYRRIQITII